ncbi:MAG: selenocysteine-specific translation elongation factor [Candidatus Acidiferrum sp.]
MKNVIVGTAGHIDHGKSALVEALTGTHPDRLEEEKRRGITIDLGFAFLEQDDVRFGFVDVPGHERFVSNMLAGAGGIDIVLLVIAADELIKPQTREHFAICRLLGVSSGIVALTKSDLADEDTLGLAKLEVEEFLSGTFLEKAPIVSVSAKTGAGLHELRAALLAAAKTARGKDAERYLRLPIDRSFAMKGFGTVVTGTLISGSVGVGDEVELLPGGERLRVRGVHSEGKELPRAAAGQRTAVNLAGIEHSDVKRGMMLASAGRFRATRRLDARAELLSSAQALKHRTKLHFHAGTAEANAEILLYGEKVLAPGQKALAHFKLDRQVVVLPDDRFILRQFSPNITIGGGVVLDPLARRPFQKDTGRADFLSVLERGTSQNKLAAMAERAVLGLKLDEIVARTGWTEEEAKQAAQTLSTAGKIQIVTQETLLMVTAEKFAEILAKIESIVEKFHKENPLAPGIPREQLRVNVGRRVRAETFRAALDSLVHRKKIEVLADLVRKAGAQIALQPEEARAMAQMEKAFAEAGLAVPAVNEVLAKLPVEKKRAEKILHMLLREKILLRVSPELIFHREALAHLKGLLVTYKKAKGERVSVPAFKELAGISRKYAIPLLEYLDRERVTKRAGDERVIL